MKVYEPASVARAQTMAPALGEIVPAEVAQVFREFRTAEVATLGKDGTPLAWPLAVLYQPEKGRFLTTTSIGLPQKAFNIRREPKVSLLFSDHTASGLENPPAALVQGEALVEDDVRTSPTGFEEYWKRLFERQPAGKMYGANALARYLMDWYYMRLYIYVRPSRILWWPGADFGQKPNELEVDRVG